MVRQVENLCMAEISLAILNFILDSKCYMSLRSILQMQSYNG
jgi:hypothetical protein